VRLLVAREAMRTALDLQQRFVEETLEQPELPLTVGIGLDAGEAVAVQGGYRGGALNLAARLCGQARAGEILASREVTHLQSWIGRHRHRGNDMTAATGMLIVAPFDGIDVDATNHSAQRRKGHRRSTATCTRRIGFYRNMTTADAAAAGVAISYSMVGRDQLPAVWVLFFPRGGSSLRLPLPKVLAEVRRRGRAGDANTPAEVVRTPRPRRRSPPLDLRRTLASPSLRRRGEGKAAIVYGHPGLTDARRSRSEAPQGDLTQPVSSEDDLPATPSPFS
jgi:hypothetical protein